MKIKAHKSGFTLIELLVSVTIIVVLMGLIGAAYSGFSKRAKKAKSEGIAKSFSKAVNDFHDEYGRFPFPTGSTVSYEENTFISSDSTEMAGILSEMAGKSKTVNIKGKNFLQIDNAKAERGGVVLDANGVPSKLMDANGTELKIIFNTSYSNSGIELPTEYQDADYDVDDGDVGKAVKTRVILYNSGLDKEPGNTDDIVSW